MRHTFSQVCNLEFPIAVFGTVDLYQQFRLVALFVCSSETSENVDRMAGALAAAYRAQFDRCMVSDGAY